MADDDCALLTLLALLLVLGNCMTRSSDRLRQLGLHLAGVALLAAAGWLWQQSQPVRPEQWLRLVLRALLVAGFVLAGVWIIVPVLVTVWAYTFGTLLAVARKALEEDQRRQQKEEQERERAEMKRRAETPPPPAPPAPPAPTKEELLQAAKEKYEGTLKLLDTSGLDDIELAAAKAEAKKKYLRAIDEAMR